MVTTLVAVAAAVVVGTGLISCREIPLSLPAPALALARSSSSSFSCSDRFLELVKSKTSRRFSESKLDPE